MRYANAMKIEIEQSQVHIKIEGYAGLTGVIIPDFSL